MLRQTEKLIVNVTDDPDTSPTLDLGTSFSAAKIYTPADYTSTVLYFYTQNPATGTFAREFTAGGTAVTLPIVAGSAQPLPEQLFAARYLRIVSDEDDSDKPVGIIIRA